MNTTMKKIISLVMALFTVFILQAQVTISNVKTFTVGAGDGLLLATKDRLFFAADNNKNTEGQELWVSNGTSAGTLLLKNINPEYRSSYPDRFKEALGKVLFIADSTGTTGTTVSTTSQLYITDGTAAGTLPLCVLSFNYPASEEVRSSIMYGKELNGKYYFSAETSADGAELWVTDGTRAGTKMVKDIYPANFSSFPKNFEILNGVLYFTATTALYGSELWKSDGTEAGTVLVKDLYPGNKGYTTGMVKAFQGKLYFAAADKDSNKGIELWVSDGTDAGTTLLKDLNINSLDSSPENFFDFDGKLYFTAGTSTTGRELFVTDGTVENTGMVQDINPGTSGSNPNSFVVVGNTLYFTAKDATYGSELRKLVAGSNLVTMVKDLAAGTTDGVHTNFYSNYLTRYSGKVALGNNLVFTARDNANSAYQVWITDGTAEGTKKLLYNNAPGTSALGFTVFKNEVYFFGNYQTKYDLYKISGIPTALSSKKEQSSMMEIAQVPDVQTLKVRMKKGLTDASIRIYDVRGRCLHQQEMGSDELSISVAAWPGGMYVVELRSKEGMDRAKCILD